MSSTGRDAEGGSYIPASQRPDGTWRKPRRVKDGYVPQEEVPLYESKGRQFASRMSKNCPVGLTPEIIAEAKAKREAKNVRCPTTTCIIPITEAKKKKNKNVDSVTDSMAKASLGSSSSTKKPQVQGTDPAKRLKNLRKKMREIEVLEIKLQNGEIENPEKDQLEKVKNKKQVQSEIEALEAIVEQ